MMLQEESVVRPRFASLDKSDFEVFLGSRLTVQALKVQCIQRVTARNKHPEHPTAEQ